MKASEFDARFEQGEDITEFLDLAKATRPGRKTTIKSETIIGPTDDVGPIGYYSAIPSRDIFGRSNDAHK